MEAWRTQIAQSGAEKWAECLSLQKVKIDEKNHCTEIWFSASQLVPVLDYVTIEKAFAEKLSGRIEVHISTEAARSFFENFDGYLDTIQSNIVFWQPELKADVEQMVFLLDAKTLFVQLPKVASLHLWNMSGISEKLRHYILEAFSISIQVQCSIPDNSQTIDRSVPSAPAQKKAGLQENGNRSETKAGAAIWGKPNKRYHIVPIDSIDEESGQAVAEGVVFKQETRETYDKSKIILTFALTDYTDSIHCKLFLDKKNDRTVRRVLDAVQKGKWFRVFGEAATDKYSGNEAFLRVNALVPIAHEIREDHADEKRVELHLHTQMSTMDSTISMKDVIDHAVRWGHTAVAVTDHGVVQSFPQFYDMAERAGIKAIFGMEGYLTDDSIQISQDQTYVVFDLETTGLKEKHHHITEIGAVKIENGQIVDRFASFINPGVAIPKEITTLTGITNEMVADAPPANVVLQQFWEFIQGSVLVAHNANFDMKFIMEHGSRYQIAFDNDHVDTLTLARYLLRDLDHHRLNDLTEYFHIALDHHHRADCDAEATALVLLELLKILRERDIETVPAVTAKQRERPSKERNKRYHIIFLVKNAQGLENLYKLVTYSHLNHYQRRPTIPRSLLCLHREGLFVGSACSSGELYDQILRDLPHEELRKTAEFYDYLEIQPIGNNEYLLREEIVENEAVLRDHNRKILALADEMDMLCVATSDAHFAEPEDAIYRTMLLAAQKYTDADEQPPIYMKTTDEMLKEFSYLGEERAYEVVVENTNAIAAQCEMMRPFPKETCQPLLEGAEEELTTSCYEKAHEMYGSPLPPVVQERLDRELNAITKYGFSVLYVIARKLVLKSNADGYLVGSRGSVGSSVAAFFSGITEVNALPPHYICPNCQCSDFDIDLAQYACGCDLSDATCPQCGTVYKKDGYNIPFETFLGFEGDKVPDIDLNFSGDYQPVAHKYTEVLFGKGYVFRAGTISGVQEKTAYGYVKKYCEEHEIQKRRAEMERLAGGCCGVKRTTGQHPGGIVVVPRDRSIFEFTPLQHPADKEAAGSITTHFDFNSMHDTLVKLDILGHDDPTMIRMLQDLTGIDPQTIPLDDPETMSLFSSVKALQLDPKELGSEVGTYGIPEFGTNFVRRMLVETKPKTMEELVRISGLSHGTDVWTNNAQELVKSGTTTLSEAICTRDDIMTYLIMCGLDKKESFEIMEKVRKGKGLTDDMEKSMRACRVADWYIASCKKIKYMFPRAHAAAYVMMAFRIAYCKVHHPLAYYATYFSVRADAFDIQYILGGAQKIRRSLKELQSKGNDASVQEKSLILALELVLEMNLRGIEFENIDIMRSDAVKCLITDDHTLLPPLNAVPGLGEKVARSIVEARADGPFSSKEDMQQRCKIGQSTTALLTELNCLQGLAESDQFSFF